jgi:hypothetical protein
MPSIRRRGNRWMVLYRDETGRQRSAGSYSSEAEARRVKRSQHDGEDQPKPKTYSTKALGTVAWTWPRSSSNA